MRIVHVTPDYAPARKEGVAATAPTPSRSPAFRRIVILTQYYAPEPGAPPIRLRAMAAELRRTGCEVRVLTGMPNYPTGKIRPGYEGRLTMREMIDDVVVRRAWLYPATGRNAVRRLLNYLSFTASSTLMLATEPRADLVFVEAQPITLALPALLNRWIRGTPYVYNTPDLQVEYAEEGRWGVRALVRAARGLEGFLMRRALSVTTVTHAFIEHFHRERELPRERLTFLPNGADTERLRPMPRDAALAERLGVGDRKVFTFAGTHAPYQGLEVILDAAKLLQHRTDIVFLMIGEGPVRADLMKRAEAEGIANVLFRSSPFDEMPRLMSLTWASLVVLRRMNIATKMRLSKAIPPLACGVPIIYAGWGETAEIVDREQVGLTVEPENAKALAAAVERLADHPDLRHDLGRRGRALAVRDLSWQYLVKDWMRQIERVARNMDPEVPLSPS
jgi:glycosyltransferase involved in cell wall biosynthesis